MADELRDIVQRMIDAGETEENIATVIRSFPSQPDAAPTTGDTWGDRAQRFLTGFSEGDKAELAKRGITNIGAGTLPFGASPVGLNPVGMLRTAAATRAGGAALGGLKEAAFQTPIVGPMARGFLRGASRAWRGAAPNVAAPSASAATDAAPAAERLAARPQTVEDTVEYLASLGKKPLTGWQKKALENYEGWVRR